MWSCANIHKDKWFSVISFLYLHTNVYIADLKINVYLIWIEDGWHYGCWYNSASVTGPAYKYIFKWLNNFIF